MVNILLVEDDMLDIMDMKRTLDRMRILHKTQIARNGEEARTLLSGYRPEDMAAPDMILLDLNMPKMNGFEFLAWIRQQEQWRNVKVFIITTSDEETDREHARVLGTSGYIIKPFKINHPASMDAFNLMIDLMNIRNRTI